MEAKDFIKELAAELEASELESRKSILGSDYEDDARSEKIANLRAMVNAGIYEVPSKDIAAKLLKMLF